MFVSVRQDSKDIEESDVSHIKKYATKNETSHQLNLVNWRKNKVFCLLTQFLDEGSCIGIRTDHTNLKSVWLMTDSAMKAHTAELKRKIVL